MFKKLFESVLPLFFPLECEVCSRLLPLQNQNGVCPQCRQEIKKIPAPHCAGCGRTVPEQGVRCAECCLEQFCFDRAFACSHYEGQMKELLHLYKFRRRKHLKKIFLSLAQEFMQAHLRAEPFDMVVAVPIAPDKKRERGFNQAEFISKSLAEDLKIPDASRVLSRPKPSVPQSSLKKTDRRHNVRGAFLVRDKNNLKGKRVLLVDDILTTGQTASECARTLKEAGAKSVSVLALARGF